MTYRDDLAATWKKNACTEPTAARDVRWAYEARAMRIMMIALMIFSCKPTTEDGNLELVADPPPSILVGTRYPIVVSSGIWVTRHDVIFASHGRGPNPVPFDAIFAEASPPIFDITYYDTGTVLLAPKEPGTATITIRGELRGKVVVKRLAVTAVAPGGILHRVQLLGPETRALRAGDHIELAAGFEYEMNSYLLEPDGTERGGVPSVVTQLARPITGDAISRSEIDGSAILASPTPRRVQLPGGAAVTFVAPATGTVSWTPRGDDWIDGKLSLLDAAGEPIAAPFSLGGEYEILTPTSCATLPKSLDERRPDQGGTRDQVHFGSVIIGRKSDGPCQIRVKLARPGQPAFVFESTFPPPRSA
jgi:hypothetical protein